MQAINAYRATSNLAGGAGEEDSLDVTQPTDRAQAKQFKILSKLRNLSLQFDYEDVGELLSDLHPPLFSMFASCTASAPPAPSSSQPVLSDIAKLASDESSTTSASPRFTLAAVKSVISEYLAESFIDAPEPVLAAYVDALEKLNVCLL